jgi:hypothetical protein
MTDHARCCLRRYGWNADSDDEDYRCLKAGSKVVWVAHARNDFWAVAVQHSYTYNGYGVEPLGRVFIIYLLSLC